MPEKEMVETPTVLGVVASMTGFARIEGEIDGLAWTWEVKSVNGKSLDLRFRLPPGFDALELPLRALANEKLKRGAVNASLSIAHLAGASALKVNRQVLEQVLALAREVSEAIEAAPPRIDGLLALRGVLESGEELLDAETRERRMTALTEGCGAAFDALSVMRREEGRRLAGVLTARMTEISGLIEAAETSAAVQPESIRAQLRALIDTLKDIVPSVSEERLAQEAALVVAKADIREELDRLSSHVAAARALLDGGGTIGRRLDFLCQEFNREANTLCAKSADLELTRLGLALKAAIEQFREQVQNVE